MRKKDLRKKRYRRFIPLFVLAAASLCLPVTALADASGLSRVVEFHVGDPAMETARYSAAIEDMKRDIPELEKEIGKKIFFVNSREMKAIPKTKKALRAWMNERVWKDAALAPGIEAEKDGYVQAMMEEFSKAAPGYPSFIERRAQSILLVAGGASSDVFRFGKLFVTLTLSGEAVLNHELGHVGDPEPLAEGTQEQRRTFVRYQRAESLANAYRALRHYQKGRPNPIGACTDLLILKIAGRSSLPQEEDFVKAFAGHLTSKALRRLQSFMESAEEKNWTKVSSELGTLFGEEEKEVLEKMKTRLKRDGLKGLDRKTTRELSARIAKNWSFTESEGRLLISLLHAFSALGKKEIAPIKKVLEETQKSHAALYKADAFSPGEKQTLSKIISDIYWRLGVDSSGQIKSGPAKRGRLSPKFDAPRFEEPTL